MRPTATQRPAARRPTTRPAPATRSTSTTPTAPWWHGRPRRCRRTRTVRRGRARPRHRRHLGPQALDPLRRLRRRHRPRLVGPRLVGLARRARRHARARLRPGRASSTSARPVRHGLAVDEGGAYVVTDEALHRLVAGRRRRAAGRRGARSTPARAGRRRSCSTAASVAVTDSVEARLGVVFLARDTGAGLCRQSVFEEGDGATDSTLAAARPRRRGRPTTTATPRRGARCSASPATRASRASTWSTAGASCSGRARRCRRARAATASWPNGLVYAWTKRPSLTGVSAWYLTALDADVRSHHVERAHRHRAARRQRRLADHARPRRLGLARHAGRAGPGARPHARTVGSCAAAGQARRARPSPRWSPTAAAAPSRRARAASMPTMRGTAAALAGAARADVRRPRAGRRWPPSGSARRRPPRTARPALTAASRIGGAALLDAAPIWPLTARCVPASPGCAASASTGRPGPPQPPVELEGEEQVGQLGLAVDAPPAVAPLAPAGRRAARTGRRGASARTASRRGRHPTRRAGRAAGR